jgi:hypothetical protein
MHWLERVTLIYTHLDAKEWQPAIIIASKALPVWKDHVKAKRTHVTGIPWLQSYTAGWVLTRILHAGAKAYFRLKMYTEQAELLELMLSQTMYCQCMSCMMTHDYVDSLTMMHPAKRGKWAEELAKILDLYIDKDRAIQVCITALSDTFCVSGRRKAIQKRLIRLFKGKARPDGVDFGDDVEVEPFPDTVLYGTLSVQYI